MSSRARLITGASFTGSLGWGLILPFQYAYVVDTRGWGSATGVLAGTAFCLGAMVAAPSAGRLADQYPAKRVAVVSLLVAAVASLGLGAASTPLTFLAAIAVFGAAITATAPATQVLVLDCIEPHQRRSVFAYQFTSLALGMAVGAFVGGHTVDLGAPDGMWPAFFGSFLGFAVAAVLVQLVTSDANAANAANQRDDAREAGSDTIAAPRADLGGAAAYRLLARDRRVRLLAAVSIALTAGFYAQFETGLPAFALDSLHVSPGTVGTAAAVNCLVIVALQWFVVRITGAVDAAGLLCVVGAIWVAAWLMLGVAMFVAPGHAGAIFVASFAVFAVGETMFAPVLGPLAASVAPPGMVGTTLGAISALRTGVSAAGPLVAGVLLAANLPYVFVLGHVAINAAAAVLALRLRAAMSTTVPEVDNGQIRQPRRSIRV